MSKDISITLEMSIGWKISVQADKIDNYSTKENKYYLHKVLIEFNIYNFQMDE